MKKFKGILGFSVLVLCLCNLSGSRSEEDETAPMEEKEREALYSAVQDLVGKWWNGSDLYPDPCGWTPIPGVSCDLFQGFWYVTDLSIGPVHDNSLNCGPKVEFTPHLFALTHLRSLSFFSCFVSHPVSIPTRGWESLADSLESLEFRSNKMLTGNIPFTFGDLKNLQSLVLTENKLSGELPQSIGELTNLQRLNLAGNSFSGEVPDSFNKLNRLLILDISRNSLSGFIPSAFVGLTSLLKLDSSNNQLQGTIPPEIGYLRNLTLLDLSNNCLTGGLTRSLQELRFLKELILSNNPIGGDMMSLDWKRLKGIVALDLANTSLTCGIPESMGELSGLRFLGLNDNWLTGDIPVSLARLPDVGAMYIHGNNLTGEIKFPGTFYAKMRRRFGAWDNPQLCYPMGLIESGYVPFGVKQCEEGEVVRYGYGTHWGGIGNWNRSGASLKFSGLLAEVIMVLVFNILCLNLL